MMEKMKFFDRFTDDADGDKRQEAIEEVFRQLDGAPHDYYDVPGDGTLYIRPGTLSGAGFAVAKVQVTDGGMVQVSIGMGPTVPPERQAAVRKLFRKWSSTFKLKGLILEDGKPLFKTEAFDPFSSRFGIDEAVGLGLSTVHVFNSAILALEAGVKPWKLLEYGDSDDDDDDVIPPDPGDGGEGDGGGGITLERLMEAFRHGPEADRRPESAAS